MKTRPPKSEGQKFEEWLKRTAPAFRKKLNPEGMHLRRPSGQNPIVDVANEVFQKAARRKLN